MGPRAEGQRSEDEFEQLLQIRSVHFKLHLLTIYLSPKILHSLLIPEEKVIKKFR